MMNVPNDESQPVFEGRPPPNQHHPVYQTQIAEDDELAFTIPVAVAEVTEQEHDELPLLYAAVDPDQLNAIIHSLRDTRHSAVRFSYADHLVEIQGSGKLTLWKRTDN